MVIKVYIQNQIIKKLENEEIPKINKISKNLL